jgi:hypothetical protein
MSDELKDPKSDMSEFNQFLKTYERQSVKEVLLTEVNTISAKINSLTIREHILNDATWSDIVAGKQKIGKVYLIPIVKNCYVTL